MITSEEIKRRLWNGANELRGSMDASRYKDYMLGLMFYKFLSDKTLETFKANSGNKSLSDEDALVEYTNAQKEYGEGLEQLLKNVLGYYVLPEYLYHTWLKDINNGDFEVQKVIDSLNNFERTIAVNDDSDDFKGIFSSSTLDLTDNALGSNLNERSKNIKALIMLFADLNMVDLQKGDILGDAYEYLIGMFAMESGKKAGEFYTPRQVSEVMAQIVSKTSDIKSIYDPTVGSGSLLLTVGKHLDEDSRKNLSYYGQEKNTATFNLTRMNLLLHGVKPSKMTIKNGDTLSQDWPEDPKRPNEGVQFDAVVMNPPYSIKNWNRDGLKVSDPRFEIAGVLPPDSKGDYAFLLHGLFHLGQNGTMAIVLPHGVLFRGGTEGEIRKRLLEKNYIDTIIGMPANLFTNTGIPVVVIILKKNREIGEPVLIIDASNSYIKVGKQNALQEKDIARIVDAYLERKETKGYCHLASREEIVNNEYNLNIPRYVESMNQDIPHDVDAHLFGGIPLKNIIDLKILNSIVHDVLFNSMVEIRPNYMQLTKSVDDLSKEIMSDLRIVEIKQKIEEELSEYLKKYYEEIKALSHSNDINSVMNSMYDEIKQILDEFDFIDIYDGYQIIAEIWKNHLSHDAEIIAQGDFYAIGRTREPNMVTKGSGSKKHEEQDGWVGSIIPNELIAKRLFSTELENIELMKQHLQSIETEISDLIEASGNEDSEEANALEDTLNDDKTAFVTKEVKSKLKVISKNTKEYEILKKVDTLFTDKSTFTKDIKEKELQLKQDVQNKIIELTDDEINTLTYEKWFGTTLHDMMMLVETPLKNELNIIDMLNKRYEQTLDQIDEECRELEKLLAQLQSELVVL